MGGGLPPIAQIDLGLAPADPMLPRAPFPMRDFRRRAEAFPPFSGDREYRRGEAFLRLEYAGPIALKPDPLFTARDAVLHRGVVWVDGQVVPGSGPVIAPRQMQQAEQWGRDFPRLLEKGQMPLLPGTTALVHTPGFRNYFHWMVESLPRLKLLSQYRRLGIGPIDRILINQSAPRGFLLDSIGRFFPDLLPIVEFAGLPHYRLEHALFFLDWRGVAPMHTRVKTTTALFLNDVQAMLPPPPGRAGRALLISRNDADNRRLVNEDALLAAFAPLGLEAVQFTGMGVAEQMRLMQQARLVVGVHGAGLTNTIFCPPGTAVLEITSTQYIRRCRSYADIAAFRGFPYGVAVVDQQGEAWVVTKNRGNDLAVAPDALADLRGFAERLLAQAPPPAAPPPAAPPPAAPPPVTATPATQPSPGAEMDKEQLATPGIGESIIGRLNELIRLQQLALLGPDRVLEFAMLDRWVRLHLPLAGTDVIQRRILAQRNFFEAAQLAEIRPLIGPDSVVLDAGANIGNHTVFFALICGARQVHAFEPMRVAFSTLQRNVQLNDLTNVLAYNLALGASEGEAQLLRYVEHNTGGSVLGLDAPGGGYRVVPIDCLALERCDFIKIDVEGAQIQALDGAAETIARCRPMVWVELRSRRDEFAAGNAWFERHGYRLVRPIAASPDDFLFGPA
jgi:FkbM family methyltransferase